MEAKDFFTEYGEANRYVIKEIIGALCVCGWTGKKESKSQHGSRG
jgi:hypothetical protein